jgi:predicted transposase YdaD
MTTAMHEYDKCGKYMIQHHGNSILRAAGARPIVSWKPLQAELVQHRRLPDGLIEVLHRGEHEPDTYLVEIATYPHARVAGQVMDEVALYWLGRHKLPEVVVLFLDPEGKVAPVESMKLNSRQGCTAWHASWRIVKLWELPAEDLLSAGDVGLVPWVPLSKFDGPPEPIMHECRARIDRIGSRVERENLLAVTQFLARLRYNDEALFAILGGRQAMIESPLLQELRKEWTEQGKRVGKREGKREGEIKAIVTVLVERFGTEAESVATALERIDKATHLQELLRHAATCRSLASFRKKLTA